ncbi:MAG: PEP/pyruvate-binding domain-containing protein [Candidatus Thorarchaeota archaeon]
MSQVRKRYIIELSQIGKRNQVGNKAKNLSYLLKKGYDIPRTMVCIFDAYLGHQSGSNPVLVQIEEELSSLIEKGKKYSVRSSANIEDATSYSFAGQFATHLNVQGVNAIIDAIVDVWKSADKVSMADYAKTRKNGEKILMGVIIQEMVKPKYAGVVFTKNPLTGLDEVIVESVDGYGDALVQEGVTPDRWVYKWGEWLEEPEALEDRFSVIESLIQQSQELAKTYGAPLDLEWCFDGNQIYWLQLRAITALESTKLFSNRLSREFLPGMIKPLVWSVNIPVINSSWKSLFKEVIGSAADSINIHNLSKQFYYRAYFNMGVIGDIFEVLGMPREALEILAGIESAGKDRPMFRPSGKSFSHLPRMLLTALRKLMFSKSIEVFLKEYGQHYNRINSVNVETLNIQETIEYIDELFELNSYGSYMVIVAQLLNNLYNLMLNRVLSSNNIETEDMHLVPQTQRLRNSDPRHMLTLLHKAYSKLPENEKTQLQQGINNYLSAHRSNEFSELLSDFMNRFGHLSDSGNDFSTRPWRETPELVLDMIKSEAIVKSKGHSIGKEFKRMVLDKRMNKTIYKKAMRYQEYRELVNSLYTFGYSQFRRFFLHLAVQLQEQNLIEDEEDIFYLDYKEIQNLINNKLDARAAQALINQRRREMEEYSDVVLPEIIIGDIPPLNLDNRKIGMELTGVGTSGGIYTGPARVVRGVGDFGKIQEGDVLVIPYSDVSWTPLFSLAKAVVSESGGLLSHCSIVAREYGIPAVVSVDAATQIEDGTTLAVDGNNGLVVVMRSD